MIGPLWQSEYSYFCSVIFFLLVKFGWTLDHEPSCSSFKYLLFIFIDGSYVRYDQGFSTVSWAGIFFLEFSYFINLICYLSVKVVGSPHLYHTA